mgnify:CR=1 FL=1
MDRIESSRRWRRTIAALVVVLVLLAALPLFWWHAPEPVAVARASSPAPAAPIHALVIGINDYRFPSRSLTRLNGAVRDAEDVADAIRALGGEVTLLTDGAATRDAIEAAWKATVARAPRGSTMFLTFSGHGGQEPELRPGLEVDGKSETTLLGGFTTDTREGTRERIFDQEWKAWIRMAEGRNVITFFDSCHSGTPTRQFQVGQPWLTRNAGYPAISAASDGVNRAKVTELSSVEETDSPLEPFETSIGAALDGELVYEIPIDGVVRGAASVYFARALRGHADADGDGQLTRKELRTYMVANVRQATASRQQATVAIHQSASLESPLLAVPRTAAQSSISPIRYAINGMAPAEAQALARTIADGRLVPQAQASLVWRTADGSVANVADGDPVAERIANAEQFKGVVAKWSAVQRVKQLMEDRPIDVDILEGDRRFKPGPAGTVTFQAEAAQRNYLIWVNLASDGKIQVVAPIACTGREHCRRWLTIQPPVSEPFGADHLVVIATDEPPIELFAAVKGLDGQSEPEAFLGALRQQVERAPTSIGMVGFYTSATGE